jgi:hypothetical protein
MLKIRDRIALGTIAGLIGTIPGLALNYISVQLGLSKFYSFQLTGSIYLFPGLTDSLFGYILGGMVWLTFGVFLGIAIIYLIEITGEDYWWLKGVVVSFGIMFVGIYGVLYTFGAARIVPFDIATNMTEAISNIIFGLFTAYLIVKWRHKPA